MDVADNGVAALDVVVEKIEWLTRIVRFEPERYLAEFDGQWIQVHAKNTSADHIAHGRAKGDGRWLLFTRAYGGQCRGDTAGGGQQNMARAAGNIRNP